MIDREQFETGIYKTEIPGLFSSRWFLSAIFTHILIRLRLHIDSTNEIRSCNRYKLHKTFITTFIEYRNT